MKSFQLLKSTVDTRRMSNACVMLTLRLKNVTATRMITRILEPFQPLLSGCYVSFSGSFDSTQLDSTSTVALIAIAEAYENDIRIEQLD